MKIISIDDRLLSIASLIEPCNTIADIGTDHGYLPIYLIQTNKVKKAIASDVAKLPLSKAIENINKYNLNDKITPILSNGLEKINKEVDTVIMAGMGANLIMDILTSATHKYETYILQANLNVDSLRRYLMENNYQIIDEVVTFAHKKYYEILKVKVGNQKLDDSQIKYGPINLSNKSELFIKKWQSILNKYQIILSDFKGSNDEKNRLLNEVDEINKMLKG